MTRSYLFLLLIIGVIGGTGLATDGLGGVDVPPSFESTSTDHNFSSTDVVGAIEFGPVSEKADLANPFEHGAAAGETSIESSARSTRAAYRSVEEWFQGDGFALGTSESEEYWRGTNSCEVPPIAMMRTTPFALPFLAPLTVRNQQGVEITLKPGMEPAELIKVIRPLPGCIHKLLRLDKSLAENAGIRRAFLLEGNTEFGRMYTGVGQGVFDPVPMNCFVTSKLFPNHLFYLHFEGIAAPELKGVQIVDGSHLMWLRYAQGETLPTSHKNRESIDDVEGDLIANSRIRHPLVMTRCIGSGRISTHEPAPTP